MPVSGVRDLPPTGMILDHFGGGQGEVQRILIDPKIGLVEPPLLLQMALQIIEKDRPNGLELGGFGRPFLEHIVTGFGVEVAEPVPPRNRRIDGDGFTDPGLHG